MASLDAGLRARDVESQVQSWRPASGVPQLAPTGGWLAVKAAAARDRRSAATATARALTRDLSEDPELVVVLDPGSLDVGRLLPPHVRWGVHVHWSPDLLLRPWEYVGGEKVSGALAVLLHLRLRQVGRRNAAVLRRAPFLVTLTESHTARLARSRSWVVEIPNPVAVHEPLPRTSEPVPRVGFVGRLVAEKGPDLFLEAIAQLRQRVGPVRAVVAGSGPLEAELREQAEQLGLSDIAWLGWVDETDRVFAELDVLLLPSRTEAVPLVLLEALAQGCSVVAADAGSGVRDLLRGGDLGAIVGVDDADALMRAAAAALADPPHARPGFSGQLAELRAAHEPARVIDLWQGLLADLATAPSRP